VNLRPEILCLKNPRAEPGMMIHTYNPSYVGQFWSGRPSKALSKKIIKQKGLGVQEVGHLPKCEALSSKSQYYQKKNPRAGNAAQWWYACLA
jgi:hypothetical protein